MACSGIRFILGLVPAMPQLLILPAAALSFAIGWQLRRAEAAVADLPEPAAPAPDPSLIEWADVSDASACQLEIGYALVTLVDARKGSPLMRSDERRVGKAGGSTCRSWGSTYH